MTAAPTVPLWTVHVDRGDEHVWRALAGPADLEAWCRAHGWTSRDVLSGSVVVRGYPDGRADVEAELLVRDTTGRPVFDREGWPETRLLVVPMRRPLPEGIGSVAR
jgi:hypothetical protein